MAFIVVGGQGRKVGKTSVMEAIISSLEARCWTAVKVTMCHHEEDDCHCELYGKRFALSEELREDGRADSSRYLTAGASRAFWMRAKPGAIAQVVDALQDILDDAKNVIVESNSVLGRVSADVVVCVLGVVGTEVKESSRVVMEHADVFVVADETQAAMDAPPSFLLRDIQSGALGEWIAARLSA